MIEVINLTKHYGNHVAVDDINFTVKKGEIYGLLGPNGAGKSTTMNIITGYLCATSGTVKINGQDIYDEPTKARAMIGYCPEHPPLYPDMTPYEYLSFVAQLKSFENKYIRELVESAMQKTGIEDVKNRLIRNLSKGYKQRVGLAGALLGDPEVLILDEPTVGLDPKQIIEIRELIKSLAKKHTVLLSSHILSEVSAVCSKVLIVNKGKLVAFDTTANLSKLQNEQSVLTIEVNTNEKALKKALKDISEIKNTSVLPHSEQKDAITAQITYSSKKDIRANISTALGKANIAVLSMSVQTKTLEDIFLALTEDENTDSTAEGKESKSAKNSGENETAADTTAKKATKDEGEQSKSSQSGTAQGNLTQQEDTQSGTAQGDFAEDESTDSTAQDDSAQNEPTTNPNKANPEEDKTKSEKQEEV